MNEQRTVDGMGEIEHWAKIGAAALTRPEPAPMCVGDVLYDHDWTPIEAARAVLEAVDFAGAVDALRELAEAVTRDHESGRSQFSHRVLDGLRAADAILGGK